VLAAAVASATRSVCGAAALAAARTRGYDPLDARAHACALAGMPRRSRAAPGQPRARAEHAAAAERARKCRALFAERSAGCDRGRAVV